MEQVLKFRYNAMDVSSVMAFGHIKGGIRQNTKDVYFVRLLGDNGTLLRDVGNMDDQLSDAMAKGNCVYQRITRLPGLTDRAQADKYAGCYEAWTQGGKRELRTQAAVKAGISADMAAKACLEAVRVFASRKTSFSDSMEKNFVVKLLYWMDLIVTSFPRNWQEGSSVKLVSHNIVKNQEYCFFYFLTLLGMDVLLLQSRQDIEPEMDSLGLSKKYKLGNWTEQEFPEYKFQTDKDFSGSKEAVRTPMSSAPVKIHIPERRSRSRGVSLESAQMPEGKRREKSFEELARLASSVVLVGIHDKRGKLVGTGSGIMIGAKGYILTNNHVASGGCFYTVRIEEDETVYETEEVVKYHSLLDLAVLRIQRKLKPLPVYCGSQKLVRGQQVVAIGSPLGLFNSVSDGIISGFRVIDDVDMIQFTAPISHGSSGGALLNMYGEVIGISTAGIDQGQNINLAVGYECINMFIRGFTG